MNKLYMIVLLSILMTACGGGEQSTNADSAPKGQSNLSVVTQSQPTVTEFSLQDLNPKGTGIVVESTAQSSREITVPNGFDLNSERAFTFKITRSKDDNQAAYLSLCSDYQKLSDGSYSINYNSCLLRTSLNDINYETVITVTNDKTGLVAALWFMDVNKDPIFSDWRF